MARGDRLAEGIGTGRHARLSPRDAPPNMDHPSQVGAQADRPRAVKPWGPRPLVRQRTCTHEQRVPAPTGNGLSRSACTIADAQARPVGDYSDSKMITVGCHHQ